MRRPLYIVLLLLLSTSLPWHVRAAETILLGNVHDGPTGMPIQNVNVYFKGTKIGTTTDSTGFFYLHVDMQEKAQLIVKMVGYKRLTFDIEPGHSAGMQLYLEEQINSLSEVVAMPGENPAIQLIREARTRRSSNKEAPSLTTQTRTNYYVSDIRPKLLERKLWQNLQGSMIRQKDSTFLMPLPKEGYKQYIISLPEHLSFYESTLSLGEASLLSPLAASGNTFYRYWLLDSTVVTYRGEREKHYRIRFVPKNPFNPTLEGTLTLDSATLALREVRASIPREVNINYLTGLQYHASYDHLNRLTDEDIAAVLEINAKIDTTHFFPSLLAVRSNSSTDYRSQPDTLQAFDSVASAYLRQRQLKPIEVPDDSLTQAIQDSLLQRPFFRFARWVGYTAFTGYICTHSPIEIGNITETFKYTPVEHLHLGLPFRTSEQLWKHVSLGAYVGYGWRDRGIKYKAEIQATLPTPHRHLLGVSVSDNYVHSEISPFEALKNENGISGTDLLFTSYLLNGVSYAGQGYQTETRRREIRLYSENEWLRGKGATPTVETQFSLQLGHQGYGNPLTYARYTDMPSYRYASLRGFLRLGWGEDVADFYMVRRHLYGKYPTLFIGTEIGSYQLDQQTGYQVYGKLDLMLRQEVQMGIAGRLYYLLQAGVTLGAVPYPLLEIFNGNRGVTYSPDRFTLMNNYQYAADRYLSAQLHYDGRGILFNQIPGIRYLRLHELAETKVAWGGLSSKHRNVLAFPEWTNAQLLQSLQIPYVEVGCGIGNIFGVADLMAVWRLTHRSDEAAALWGIRFRMHLCL